MPYRGIGFTFSTKHVGAAGQWYNLAKPKVRCKCHAIANQQRVLIFFMADFTPAHATEEL